MFVNEAFCLFEVGSSGGFWWRAWPGKIGIGNLVIADDGEGNSPNRRHSYTGCPKRFILCTNTWRFFSFCGFESFSKDSKYYWTCQFVEFNNYSTQEYDMLNFGSNC